MLRARTELLTPVRQWWRITSRSGPSSSGAGTYAGDPRGQVGLDLLYRWQDHVDPYGRAGHLVEALGPCRHVSRVRLRGDPVAEEPRPDSCELCVEDVNAFGGGYGGGYGGGNH